MAGIPTLYALVCLSSPFLDFLRDEGAAGSVGRLPFHRFGGRGARAPRRGAVKRLEVVRCKTKKIDILCVGGGFRLGDEERLKLIVDTCLKISFPDDIIPTPSAGFKKGLLELLKKVSEETISLANLVNLGDGFLSFLRVRKCNVELF